MPEQIVRIDVTSPAAYNGRDTVTPHPHTAMPATAPRLDPADDDAKLLAAVTGYYHDCLKDNSDALAYLTNRGVNTTHLLDHFRVGFSDRSLGLRLPSKESRAGTAIRTRLQALGLFRPSGHEHLRGSLTFPIPAADGTGRVTTVYGRKVLDGHLRKGTALHTHLTDDRPGVWNVEAFGPADELVLTASMFDALTFWSAGYRHTTTTFGAVTADLLAALAEFNVQRVLVTGGADAGELLAAGVEVFAVRLPAGQDVNSYARKTRDPADALGELLRHAEWVGRGQPPSRPAPRPVPADEGPTAAELLDDDGDEGDDPAGIGADAVGPGDGPADDPDVPVEPPARTASPVPAPPPAADVTVTDTEVVMAFGSRRYRVRGFDRNGEPGQMRVNVLVANGVGLFTDTFDVYSHKHRKAFVEQAAAEMNVEPAAVKRDVGRVLLKLEELQDAALRAGRKPGPAARPDVTPADERAALDLLRDPDLLDRIAAAFPVVGGRANKLVAYLAAVSRKLAAPLSVLVQSTSAAGKTALVDAALAFCPPEDVVRFSALTGQSLYYMADGDLANKVLAVAEEAGAARASYALKLLASEGELRIASTGKDAGTGRLVTQEYRVRGPTALFLTTTSADVDEELANRCVVLTVPEDRGQTRAVHEHQRRRETLAGLVEAEAHAQVVTLHQNAQRLLRPVRVVNPWAERLTFPDASTRTRRDHAKYLGLIRAVTFLHQHQRPVRTAEVNGRAVEYVETTLEDIAAANDVAAAVLGRGLDDLPPQTRNLLGVLERMVTAGCEAERIDRADFRFTARQAREFAGWGHTQLKLHLKRLADRELVLRHRDRHARRDVYELAVAGGGDGRALP
ncbi:MAG TPA: hypothetical protein VH092_30485, partial [Urbifossiella sp.]|nr:hypothetical protein [Urbifossiella sp.]